MCLLLAAAKTINLTLREVHHSFEDERLLRRCDTRWRLYLHQEFVVRAAAAHDDALLRTVLVEIGADFRVSDLEVGQLDELLACTLDHDEAFPVLGMFGGLCVHFLLINQQ